MRRFHIYCAVVLFSSILLHNAGYAQAKELAGAGATFPQPLYEKMFQAYQRQYRVKVNYEGTGSGEGIRRIIGKGVDFAGTDAFMTQAELLAAGQPILYIPTCIGAVAIVYNLSDNPKLHLSPEILSDIFLGRITQWNDYKIATLNPGVKLPNVPVTVVHRSDSSGTTNIFSEYLAKTSHEWRNRIGSGKTISWPIGRGAKGNPGVAGLVRQIHGSIGYVELIYAIGNDMTFAALRNSSGEFVEPSMKSVSLAANVPLDGSESSLTNTKAQGGYPISGFTWLIVYQEQYYSGRSMERVEELVKLLWWMTHDGQKYTSLLHYAPLPKAVLKTTEKLLKSVTYKGSKVLQAEIDQ